MTRCPGCSKEIPDGEMACPSCGAIFDDSVSPTIAQPAQPAQPAGSTGSSRRPSQTASRYVSFDSIDDKRFAPGSILADRYRIIGMLGKGGMGEVYRADDLKLAQPVALKFLPETLAQDGAALARFHREVRVARQITHPNVCRVFDIGEIDGNHFLSMEYVDGEDLATLMRRIGRLPHDKAVDIARQLCAGLAAAHDGGVLHRDLKPANIMLDGRGKVRIMDFGLAGVADEIRGDELIAGTPAYMAPEQLAGKEVSVKSDIYSLGLVLYEIFTGKRAFEASTLDGLLRARQQSTPASLSSLIKEIDPLVERVILRCLENDPRARPASAIQVAAALPGGDPIAAALAAGETPSPEMVAASSKEGALQPMIASICLALVFFGLIAALLISGKAMLHRQAPLDKSPDALVDRARDIIKKAGYGSAPADSAYGFFRDDEYLDYTAKQDSSPQRWDKLAIGRPSAFLFWYRQSPRSLVPVNGRFVYSNDPPITISGMTEVQLDTEGRLYEIVVFPPQIEDAQGQSAEPDWAPLFKEAGLDIQNFTRTDTRWVPPLHSDARAAWEGAFPDQPDAPIRIDAASYRGKPVYFVLRGPWSKPWRMEEPQPSVQMRIFFILIVIAIAVVVIIGLLLAQRNLRLGRGDRKGAMRLALFVFATQMLQWAFGANHIAGAAEFLMIIVAAAWALLWAVFLWVLYIALEPYVRRRWPYRIIAWSRVLNGDFRDPLVGRYMLIGALCGTFASLFSYLGTIAPRWFGLPPNKPLTVWMDTLHGMRGLMGQFLDMQTPVILYPLGILFLLLLFSKIMRKEWAAILVLWAWFTFAASLQSDHPRIDWIFIGAGVALYVFVLTRFGLFAAIVYHYFIFLLNYYPITPDFSVWYAGNSIFVLLVMLAIAIYGFYTSLAGQPLVRGEFLRD